MDFQLKRKRRLCIVTWCLVGGIPRLTHSFVGNTWVQSALHPRCCKEDTGLQLFFAEESSPSGPSIKVIPSEGDESSLGDAAALMVDAFWLNSPQQLVLTNEENPVDVAVSDATRAALIATQAQDLTEKYGERMGKRLLDSCLLSAVSEQDTREILGVVGIEVCLFDKQAEQIVTPDKAEAMVKNAVASLGPKQRRQYKDSSLEELASVLLPPQLQVVCCLSNLGVSPKARRKGIACTLCNEAEHIAAVEWGYDDMFLKVESENTAARYLYEEKLGYKIKCGAKASAALRVDPQAGSFVETQADTLILTKDLN